MVECTLCMWLWKTSYAHYSPLHTHLFWAYVNTGGSLRGCQHNILQTSLCGFLFPVFAFHQLACSLCRGWALWRLCGSAGLGLGLAVWCLRIQLGPTQLLGHIRQPPRGQLICSFFSFFNRHIQPWSSAVTGAKRLPYWKHLSHYEIVRS